MPGVNGFTNLLPSSLPITESFQYASLAYPMDNFYCPALELLASTKAIAAYLYIVVYC